MTSTIVLAYPAAQQFDPSADYGVDRLERSMEGPQWDDCCEKSPFTKKLVHKILPTFQRLNKLTHGECKCPACKNAEKTRNHIIRCSHNIRGRWRIEFMAANDNFPAKENTSPLLWNVWRVSVHISFILWYCAIVQLRTVYHLWSCLVWWATPTSLV